MGGRSWFAVGVAVCAIVPASVAHGAPPLVVFDGPADAPAEVVAARAAVDAAAARHGVALLDLSPSPSPAPTAGRELAHAVEAYHGFEYAAARDHAQRALDELASTGAEGVTPAELSDLLIYRALSISQLGDEARAWEDFVRAATVDPTRRLDAARFPPRVLEPFARAVAAVQTTPAVDLAIDVDPTCKVWIDARAAVPAEPRPVAAGEHYVRVVCAGHAPYGAIAVAAAPGLRLRPLLRRLPRPTLARAIEVARDRGAGSFIWAVAATSPGAAPTLSLRRIDVASTSERARVVLRLEGRGAGAAAASAFEQVVAEAAVVAPAGPPPPTPWYRRPWVWGVTAAVVTAAVLIPLTIDSEPVTGFDLRLDGAGDGR